MKKETKIILSVIVILILFTISSFCYVANRDGIAYRASSLNLNNNWNYSTNITGKTGTISLPIDIAHLKKTETVTITNILPESQMKSPELLIKTELQNINVYLDDELIFQNKMNDEQLWGKSPESSWCFIELPSDFSGKEIKITYTSAYKDFIGKINSVIICERDFGKAFIMYINLPKLIISFIILSMGIMLCSLYFGLSKAGGDSANILYLGLLDIIFFNWVVLDNKYLDIALNGYFPSAELKIISLYFMIILFNIFLKESFYKRYTQCFNRINSIYALLLVINSVLHILNIAHYVETLKYIHICIALNFIFIIYILLKELHRRKEDIQLTAIMSLVFIIPVGSVLYSYYTMKISNSVPILEITMLLFSVIFSLILGKRFMKYYNKQIENQTYKKMAYTDSLTNTPNRAAYINQIDLLNKLHNLNYDPYLFLFDLNNLKSVNDLLGHTSGDLYITTAVKMLNSTFLEYGTIFRIGGDEFAFINDSRINIDRCIDDLSRNNIKLGKMFDNIPAGIAFGYSKININSKEFETAYSIADLNMYECKKKMKKTN